MKKAKSATRQSRTPGKSGKNDGKPKAGRRAKARSFIGSMKGTVLRYDRPLDPIDAEWDINRPPGKDDLY